jgi:hypothetical protein
MRMAAWDWLDGAQSASSVLQVFRRVLLLSSGR